MESSLVTINCGGCFYSTARETILREPSSKLALQVRGVIPVLKDQSGHTFIDRDPRFFPCILNYLRDGWVLLPGSPAERRELLQEVRHFQVRSLPSAVPCFRRIIHKDLVPISLCWKAEEPCLKRHATSKSAYLRFCTAAYVHCSRRCAAEWHGELVANTRVARG